MKLLPNNFHFSVAPMMDYTDRHARYFHRLLSPNVRLYTEMITTQAIIKGDKEYLLKYHPAEKYLALQLGGNDPRQLAYCAKVGEEYGYDEINLNVGCPSDRVKEGMFGACLMLNPKLVADCFASMQAAVSIPVTIKCRIGVDHQDSFADLCYFIDSIAAAGCKTFIIHARKAWLSGLSPKENREIPPLRYDVVHKLKQTFPQLQMVLNGGIKSIANIKASMAICDGMMIGRAAYSNPYLLAEIETEFFQNQASCRNDVIVRMQDYIEDELINGTKFNAMLKPLLGLFQGVKGARIWRRYLSENAHKTQANFQVIEDALAMIGR